MLIMQTPLFDFPIVEFCWYGIVSILSLLCFASLSYEVNCAKAAASQADNEVAHDVVMATYNVNFAVMVIANILLIASCIGIMAAQGDNWRGWFAASIFVCGAYWFYTRACEKKLILFLQEVDVYERSLRPTSVLKLFKRPS
jgi:hypothetical protein